MVHSTSTHPDDFMSSPDASPGASMPTSPAPSRRAPTKYPTLTTQKRTRQETSSNKKARRARRACEYDSELEYVAIESASFWIEMRVPVDRSWSLYNTLKSSGFVQTLSSGQEYVISNRPPSDEEMADALEVRHVDGDAAQEKEKLGAVLRYKCMICQDHMTFCGVDTMVEHAAGDMAMEI